MSESTFDVECDGGSLRGAGDRGALVFRNIPFAAPPVGDMRFEPPQDPQSWTGVRDATRNGPIAPQGRSRLGDVMGDFTAEQSEDCLTLTVWTPAADAKPRPVLVFIHGGGFSSGAGSLPWYSGRTLAVANDIVVVTVNYRLGALGYLFLPGVSPGNLGLLDNIAALRWVQRNIGRFGGDPQAVTVAGQSAGAMSTLAMMASPAARGLFHRAISQSAAFGSLARTAGDAERIGVQFAALLGVASTDSRAFKSLPVGALLEASGKLARSMYEFANTSPPFLPTIDGMTIPQGIAGALCAGAGGEIDLMLGSTREEAAAFCAIDPAVQKATQTQMFAVFERVFGAAATEQLAAYKRRRPHDTSQWLLTDIMTDEQFLIEMLRLAQARANAGRAAYVYQFDWQSHSQRGFAACHCLELPFVFGNLEDWPDAPMLEGADSDEVTALGRVMVAAWGNFVRSGSPNHPDLPPWPAYESVHRSTMRFDRVIGPVDDLAGLARRLPWP